MSAPGCRRVRRPHARSESRLDRGDSLLGARDQGALTRFQDVAYDLRGHGKSAPAAGGDYSLQRFGEDLEAVLAGAVPQGRRVVVAGHSLGAMSIAAWAEQHDVNRIRAAALLFTGLGSLVAEQLLMPPEPLASTRTIAS